MKWHCPKCGMLNDGRFCGNCGADYTVENVPPNPIPPGYNGAGINPALMQKQKKNSGLKIFLIVVGAVFAAIVLFVVGMILFGMSLPEETPMPTTTATATTAPTKTPEPEPTLFMGFMSKLGEKAYWDVASIEPCIGVGMKINDKEPNAYTEVVCTCTSADGAIEYVVMKVEEYNQYIDATANVTNVDDIRFEKVEFSPTKRIIGKVVSTETTEGVKEQTGRPKMLEFESIQ